MSIRRSLTLRFVLLVAFLLATFSVIIYRYHTHLRKTEYADRLCNQVMAASRIIIQAYPDEDQSKFYLDQSGISPRVVQQIAIVSNTNKFITKGQANTTLTGERLKLIRQERFIQFQAGDTLYVGMIVKHQNQPYVVLAGTTDLTGRKKPDDLLMILAICFGAGVFITALLGGYFTLQALKPFRGVADEAEKISVTNLHKRISVENDTSEVIHLQMAFNKILEQLEASFLMQKNFVSNASHEFRTPITAMKAQIEVMLMQERTKEEYINTLKSLDDDINQFMHLVFSLSELAKANNNTMEHSSVAVPLIEMVAETRAELLRSKPHFQINLQILSLPDDDEENYIFGNVALIKSAIKNLIENACKFSPDHCCSVSVNFEPGYIVIIVSDEGIGIPADELNLIFEPFYRVNDTRGIAGHGIGLSLVQKIINLHNGSIRVESEQSKGTNMIITLPNMRKRG